MRMTRMLLRLSRDAYYFMAGILKHMKAMTILTNPLVNSYKRLIQDSMRPFILPGHLPPTAVP